VSLEVFQVDLIEALKEYPVIGESNSELNVCALTNIATGSMTYIVSRRSLISE
jgi:hypothetical protein